MFTNLLYILFHNFRYEYTTDEYVMFAGRLKREIHLSFRMINCLYPFFLIKLGAVLKDWIVS